MKNIQNAYKSIFTFMILFVFILSFGISQQVKASTSQDVMQGGQAASSCFSSTGAWTAKSFPTQTGIFTVTFTAKPSNTYLDGVIGLSNGKASAYTKLAAIVRFNDKGKIDARNGSTYKAASSISYKAGQIYSFRMVINVITKTYLAYVTVPGSGQKTIGTNYSFRTEQATVGQLNNFASVVDPGGQAQICNFLVVPASTATPTSTSTGTTTSTYTPSTTLTPTITVTATRTPSLTITPTVTNTLTPTYTRTPTPTVTGTATVTPTSTFTKTITPTATVTTLSYTSTPTPSQTVTPTPDICAPNVFDVNQLRAAVLNAVPGSLICLAPGSYTLAGNALTLTTSGVPNSRIILMGPRNAILDGGSTTSGKGVIYMNNADYWTITGITITNGKKGIMMDFGTENIIDDVLVQNIGEEGIHLRKHSKYNVIQNSIVRETGLVVPDYGEAFYIGSDKDKWNDATFTPGEVPDADYSDYNQILHNHCGPNVRAECVDVKEGTSYGIVSDNVLDATGLTNANSADSLMDIKGNYWTISNNTGTNPAGLGAPNYVDAIQVNMKELAARPDLGQWGNYNTFTNNTLDVRSSGFGFNIDGNTVGNKVCNDNTVTNAGSGIANISVAACSFGGASVIYPADLTTLEKLEHWKIEVPVSFDNPPISTHAGEKEQPDLASYSFSPYFMLNASKTGILFQAIAGGARTSSGTAYSRSELRQMKGSASAPQEANWSCSGVTTSMYVQEALLHTTTNKPEAVIAQIHDGSDDKLMVKYVGLSPANGSTDTGSVKLIFNSDNNTTQILDSAYTLGDLISLKVSMVNGQMSVIYQNLNTNAWTVSGSAQITGAVGGCYFKTGMYIQACTTTDIYGNTNDKCTTSKPEAAPFAHADLLMTRLFLINPQFK